MLFPKVIGHIQAMAICFLKFKNLKKSAPYWVPIFYFAYGLAATVIATAVVTAATAVAPTAAAEEDED